MGTRTTACEVHDEAGACTDECVRLTEQMMGDDGGGEMMVYGDYLGGESSVDWSRTHEPAPRPYTVVRLDAVRHAVVTITIDPREACPVCEQPDNCGDCDHTPLTDAEWIALAD